MTETIKMTEGESVKIEKHAGGRPLKFKTPEEILEKARAYFDTTLASNLPITITGLALALKTSRETLMNYEKRDEFFDTIKEIKLVCENYAEINLFGKNPTGPIFALKNYGWADKKEIGLSGFVGGDNLTPEQRAKLDKLFND